MSLKKQMRFIEGEIEDRAPSRVDAMPLLNVVLDLSIPENDFTQNLEPKIRQSALHALLEDCLKAEAMDEPLLIVIEDLHWVDALSHDLLEGLVKVLANYRVCFVLAYRPIQMERLRVSVPRLEALAQFTKIELHELTHAEAESAIRAKLAQLYPARSGALPSGLVQTLMARAQGNPFYLEELLNYVRDRGIDPSDLNKIELPDSLHTLILSRIDQLSDQEKTTLRVASIVGRLFRANWLTGYYPELGAFPTVKASLDALESLDITPLDSPEPELAYLFKHIVTHEVTYESLPFATRAKLHEQLAMYLESIATPVDTIAYHYGHSKNQAKQREYWLKAGDAARGAFANEAALDYYARLHPLLREPREQGSLRLKRAEVYSSWGRLSEAREHMTLGLKSVGQPLPETALQWQIGLLGEILRQIWHRLRFAIKPMRDEVEKEIPEISADELELIRAYEILVLVDTLANQGSLADMYYLLRVLNIVESRQRKLPVLARVYALLGNGIGVLPMHILARNYLRLARTTMVGLDHPASLALVFYHTGLYTIGIGKWDESERAFLQALEIFDRLGDRRYQALTLNILGFLSYFQGRFEHSLKLYARIYNEGQATNHVEHQAWGLNGRAMNLFRQGQMIEATLLLNKAMSLFVIIPDSSLTELLSQGMLATVQWRQGQFEQARQSADSTARLLALAFIPVFSSLDAYSSVANVYLELWQKSQAQQEKSEMKALARQACRALHQFVRIYPIAKPRAWLWQGLYDWLDGKPNRARRAWQKSLLAAQKLAMPYDEALAYYEIGQHAVGEERETRLARAMEIFKRLGVANYA